MALRLRLRGPSGGSTINVPAGASAASLEALVREALGLGAGGTVELLGGHPPKPISASPDGTPLISSGDTLVVRLTTQDGSKRHCAEPDPTPTPTAPPAPNPPAVPAAGRVDPIEREVARRKAMEAVLATAELVLPPGCNPAHVPVVTGGAPWGEDDEEDEDAMLARAIALSQGGDGGGDGGGGGGVGGGDGGEQLVRRVVPADNSCLFVALALALEAGDCTRAAALREVVARAVLADPERFSEAVLGRPPQELLTLTSALALALALARALNLALALAGTLAPTLAPALTPTPTLNPNPNSNQPGRLKSTRAGYASPSTGGGASSSPCSRSTTAPSWGPSIARRSASTSSGR